MFSYKKILFLFIVILCNQAQAFAQKEANNWYFGTFLGYTFNTDPPSYFGPTKIRHWEDAAAISDSSGNALMYLDSYALYSADHDIIEEGIITHTSANQSGIFVPQPGNSDNIYLFTADKGAYFDNISRGIHYTLVNLCANSGEIGVVDTLKNVNLLPKATEKLTAINHFNGTDVWVLIHDLYNNDFLAYLVTEKGVSEPVISSIGTVHDDYDASNVIGHLKASPDGSKLASAVFHKKYIELFDFDNKTGIISNPKIVLNYKYRFNGMAFSPYGTKLYFTYNSSSHESFINQIDLARVGEPGYSYTSLTRYCYANYSLSLAPDGNIYSSQLNVIANSDADPEDVRIYDCVEPESPYWSDFSIGLVNFNQSYFDPDPQINYSLSCGSLTSQFRLNHTDKIASVKWDFNDSTTTDIGSNEIFTVYSYEQPGIYMAKATIEMKDGRVLERYKKVIIRQLEIDILKDALVCLPDSMVLDVSQPAYACYKWQDGSESPTYTVKSSGIYWVDIRTAGCTVRDSVTIEVDSYIDTTLPDEDLICAGSSATYLASSEDADSYLWSNGHEDKSLIISQGGEFSVIVNNGGCITYDTVNVVYQRYPEYYIPTDTFICEGEDFYIELKDKEANYTWSTGITGPRLDIDKPGRFWVKSNINGCSRSDVFDVRKIESVKASYIDTVICEGREIDIGVNLMYGDFIWSTGFAGKSISVSEAGLYELNVSTECYNETIQYNVKVENCDCDIFVPNVITPNKDGKNDRFYPVIHQNVDALQMTIFNRWGKVITLFEGLDSSWDGTVDAKIMQSGVYYYTLKYSCQVEDQAENYITKKGAVHLIY